jgi:hypothetical protein
VLLPGQQTRQLQHCRSASGVIVGAGAAGHGIIMPSHQHDLLGLRCPWDLGFEVVYGLPLSHHGLPRYLVSLPLPRRLDVPGGAFEPCRAPELALTDVPCQHVHMAREMSAESHLISAQRLERPGIGVPRHGDHDVVGATQAQDDGKAKTAPEEHRFLPLATLIS